MQDRGSLRTFHSYTVVATIFHTITIPTNDHDQPTSTRQSTTNLQFLFYTPLGPSATGQPQTQQPTLTSTQHILWDQLGDNYYTLHLTNSLTQPETTLYSYVNDLDPVQQNPRTDPYNTKLIYPTRNDTLTKIKVFQQSQCFLLGFPNMN